MRIIQSSWACNRPDVKFNQPGWLAPEYSLMSWALSVLQLKKHYKDVSLYTDTVTAKLLIDELKLPYTEVYCELDVLNKYNPELWAVPKIHVYSKQDQPFLHIDGDVFIWKAFEQDLINCDLIAQNLESATIYYSKIMKELEDNLIYFPEEILKERRLDKPILAYNAGIFGGQDTGFFKGYTKKAFEFISRNLSHLSKIKVQNFNIFFEQYLFYCLAKEQNKKVGVLFKETIGDNEYKGFGDFIEVPHKKHYLHLLGDYKRNEIVCLQLANRLRQDYPEYYYRIIALYKNSNHSLLHDYYQHLENSHEVELVKRQKELKSKYSSNLLDAKTNTPSKRVEVIKQIVPDHINEDMKADLRSFYSKINTINRNKFSKISTDYLYGRDLNATAYFEHLFSDSKTLYTKLLIAQPYTEKLRVEYDWSQVNSPVFNNEITLKQSRDIVIAMIPECNKIGYSLTNIDSLDVEILHILKTKKTIGRVLNECKRFFNKKDLEDSLLEYEKLITGRIKKGIYQKTIKAA